MVARRLAMLPLSRAPRAASLDENPWLLLVLLERLAALGSLLVRALRVLRYTPRPEAGTTVVLLVVLAGA
jgi:hypothetical protein